VQCRRETVVEGVENEAFVRSGRDPRANIVLSVATCKQGERESIKTISQQTCEERTHQSCTDSTCHSLLVLFSPFSSCLSLCRSSSTGLAK
jgi:hypothetical protein